MKRSELCCLALAIASTGAVSAAFAEADAQPSTHRKKLWNTIAKSSYPDRHCSPVNVSEYQALASRDQKYQIFRADDINREKSIGFLEIIQGDGFIDPIKQMTVDETVTLLGKPNERVPKSNSFSDVRIFDLIALNSEGQPKFFHVKAIFKDNLLDKYTVDGPGIQRLNYKEVKEVKEKEEH